MSRFGSQETILQAITTDVVEALLDGLMAGITAVVMCIFAPGLAVMVLAGALLGATILAMLAPGGLFLFPPPWNMHYVAAQVVIWLAGLIFLAEQARFEKQSAMV